MKIWEFLIVDLLEILMGNFNFGSLPFSLRLILVKNLNQLFPRKTSCLSSLEKSDEEPSVTLAVNHVLHSLCSKQVMKVCKYAY